MARGEVCAVVGQSDWEAVRACVEGQSCVRELRGRRGLWPEEEARRERAHTISRAAGKGRPRALASTRA